MTFAGWMETLAAAVVVVSAVWVLGRKMIKRVGNFLDDWDGEPARRGVAERPGVMVRLGTVEARLSGIEAELHPNGGGSMRDKVDRIDRAVTGKS